MALKINTVLALQRDMIRYWETDNGAQFAEGVAEVARNENAVHLLPAPWFEDDSTALATTLAHRTRIASTYWTKSEMADLTLLASAGRPGSAIHREDMPHMHGFTLFEDPMVVDMSGRSAGIELTDVARAHFAADADWIDSQVTNSNVNLAGFMWNQSSNNGAAGVDVILFSSPTDRRDGLIDMSFRERLRGTFRRTPPLLVLGTFFIPFGKPFEDDDAWHAIVATWWHLIMQPITTTNVQQANPNMTKRAKKLEMVPTITVVTLRPRKPAPKEEPGNKKIVEWSHRWMVGAEEGGFWRNQWYPSLGIHKPIWISMFEKGPLDKPLVIKRQKVYAWRR